MLRVLHAGYQRFHSPGIIKQLEHEQKAANDLGLRWTSRLFLPGDVSDASQVVVRGNVPSSNREGSRKEYYQWIEKAVSDFDVLLLRYLAADPTQLSIISRARKPIFLVHHTLDAAEILSSGGAKSLVKWFLERIIGPATLARSAGIIAVTREIGEHELGRISRAKPLLVYPNGVLMCETLPEPLNTPIAGPPKLFFMASSFATWQGLDRLINSAKLSQDEFTIHIVGNVSHYDRSNAINDKRFIFHGKLDQDSARDLLTTCHLGLSSFALDRKSMSEACTLKVREYLAMGVPVYAGHRDVFPVSFPYYRCGPCDIQAILEMAQSAQYWSRKEIQSAALPYIDKSLLLSKLHAELSRLVRK